LAQPNRLTYCFTVPKEGSIGRPMAGCIHRLDELTINKIAAGEVIENPASVVKELVENALDAEATDICIEILNGGRDLVRVSDNGCGMGQQDALLCLERYATSKTSSVEGLFSLDTMGFRGEALAAIAAISKVTIITSPQGAQGTLLIAEGGAVISCGAAVRDPGTTIEVKALFFNLPVRKQFLRSPNYDAQEIHKIVGTVAMGNPSVRFQLISNCKTILNTPREVGEERLQGRIASVLGKEYVASMIPAFREKQGYVLQSMISWPTSTRPNRTGQYLFINRRAISSSFIAQAVREGYGSALSEGRHPLWVVHLTIPSGCVDVNVHPQKKEVRLRYQDKVRELILDAVRSAIQQPIPPLMLPRISQASHPGSPTSPEPSTACQTFPTSLPFQQVMLDQISREECLAPFVQKPFIKGAMFDASDNRSIRGTGSAPLVPEQQPENAAEPTQLQQTFIQTVHVVAIMPPYLLLNPLNAAAHPALSGVISQPDGLVLVDIFAAQARILFEELMAEPRSGQGRKKETQLLLIPVKLNLHNMEIAFVREQVARLHQWGIELEEGDEGAFAITAVPQLVSDIDPAAFLCNLIHELQETESDSEEYLYSLWERSIVLVAGRLRRRRGYVPSLAEAQALVARLLACALPMRSPDGLATVIQLTQQELSGRFSK